MASYGLPFLFAGSMLGILISSFFPAFHLLIFITLILVVCTLFKLKNVFLSFYQTKINEV